MTCTTNIQHMRVKFSTAFVIALIDEDKTCMYVQLAVACQLLKILGIFQLGIMPAGQCCW